MPEFVYGIGPTGFTAQLTLPGFVTVLQNLLNIFSDDMPVEHLHLLVNESP